MKITPTGVERRLGDEDIIVSKTDTTGKITYVNRTFLTISSFSEKEVIGMPHSLVRHPDMPRCIFSLLWDTIKSGEEIFAYVCNLAKNGDHYWVYAHVTPTLADDGSIVGFHSNRRAPNRSTLPVIEGLYQELVAEERRGQDRRAGLQKAHTHLMNLVMSKASGYDEFIATL